MSKRNFSGKKETFSDKKSTNFIQQRELNLDEKNNFLIEISEKQCGKDKFIVGGEYLLLSLDLKLKDEDITKWTDYQKIEALPNLINATKKKNLSNVDLMMVVK